MAKNTSTITMDDLLNEVSLPQLTQGEVIEGEVLSVKKHEVWIDLGANGLGLVVRREIGFGTELEEGAKVTASVVDSELEEG